MGIPLPPEPLVLSVSLPGKGLRLQTTVPVQRWVFFCKDAKLLWEAN